MATKILRQPEHIDALCDLLRARKLPLTVSWEQGAPDTKRQNRLAQRWHTDIARQAGDRTHEQVRAFCKIRFGRPILCKDNEAMRMSFDKAFGHLTHEDALVVMEALDIPVTRLMNKPQMTEYMARVEEFFRGQGFQLTNPDDLRYETEFGPMEGQG